MKTGKNEQKAQTYDGAFRDGDILSQSYFSAVTQINKYLNE